MSMFNLNDVSPYLDNLFDMSESFLGIKLDGFSDDDIFKRMVESYNVYNVVPLVQNVFQDMVFDDFVDKFNNYLAKNFENLGIECKDFVESNIYLNAIDTHFQVNFLNEEITNMEDESSVYDILDMISKNLIFSDELKSISSVVNVFEPNNLFYDNEEFVYSPNVSPNEHLSHYLKCQLATYISDIFHSPDIIKKYKNKLGEENYSNILEHLNFNTDDNTFSMDFSYNSSKNNIDGVVLTVDGYIFDFNSSEQITDFISNPNKFGKYVLDSVQKHNEEFTQEPTMKKNKSMKP